MPSAPKVAVQRPLATAAAFLFVAILGAWATLAGAFRDPSVDGWVIPLAAVGLTCTAICISFLLKLRLRRRAVTAVAIIAAVLITVSVVVAPIAPQWAAALRYDGKLPSATGCEATSTVNQWKIFSDETGELVAEAQLRRSHECGTVWVRVRTLVSGATTAKSVSRPHSGWILGYESATELDPSTDDWSWSRQVFAPDCAVVDVVVTLQDGSSATLHEGC